MFLSAAPAPALAGLVDRYLAYRVTGGDARLHRGLPSGSLTFVVGIDRPIEVVAEPGDTRRSSTEYHAAVAGLHTGPALIANPASYAGIAIDLRPLAARRLFDLPAGALAGHTVELADLVGPVGRELHERLRESDDPDDWFADCDRVLTRLLGGVRPTAGPPPELRWAWSLLDISDGRLSVGAVADEVGWSRQHLNRRFRAEFGVSPKQLARIVRFGRSRDLLRGDHPTPAGVLAPPGSLAEVAALCGYADQSHLTREWSDLAGCTPTTWCDEEGVVPFVQDTHPVPPPR